MPFGCKLIVAIGATVASSDNLRADLVTFAVSGEVTHFLGSPSVAWSVPVGSHFGGTVVVDVAIADSLPAYPGQGRYLDSIVASSFLVGSDAVIDTGVASRITVLNDVEDYDDLYMHDGSIAFHGLNARLTMVFSDEDHSVFDSDALPLTPPPLTAFEGSDWSIGTENSDFTILGNFTSFTLHMPEPSSVLLLAGVAVALRRRC